MELELFGCLTEISFRSSSWITGLSANERNIELLRKFLNFFLDLGTVLDNLGLVSVKKLLKELAMFLGFVTSLPFTVIYVVFCFYTLTL